MTPWKMSRNPLTRELVAIVGVAGAVVLLSGAVIGAALDALLRRRRT